MNTHLFNDLMHIYRKNVSASWSAEDFLAVGFQRGKLMPVGGTMGTTLGKVDSNVTHTFYCPSDSDIQTGDILYDVHGRKHVVEYAQLDGITGNGDHMEAGLVSQ